jgi:hypothetical protein
MEGTLYYRLAQYYKTHYETHYETHYKGSLSQTARLSWQQAGGRRPPSRGKNMAAQRKHGPADKIGGGRRAYVHRKL